MKNTLKLLVVGILCVLPFVANGQLPDVKINGAPGSFQTLNTVGEVEWLDIIFRNASNDHLHIMYWGRNSGWIGPYQIIGTDSSGGVDKPFRTKGDPVLFWWFEHIGAPNGYHAFYRGFQDQSKLVYATDAKWPWKETRILDDVDSDPSVTWNPEKGHFTIVYKRKSDGKFGQYDFKPSAPIHQKNSKERNDAKMKQIKRNKKG